MKLVLFHQYDRLLGQDQGCGEVLREWTRTVVLLRQSPLPFPVDGELWLKGG